MIDITTSAGIAAAAIILSNIMVWFFGAEWTARQKAGIGAVSALVVFGAGVLLFPESYRQVNSAALLLVEALLTVLAAAGAPVYGEVLRRTPQSPVGIAATLPPTDRPQRRWAGWNR